MPHRTTSSVPRFLLSQTPVPTPTTFPRFPDLPRELQILIWSFALQPFTGNQASRLYNLTTYELSAPLPHPALFRPLITSPPPNILLTRAQLAELERTPPKEREEITVYVRRGRREKWEGFFNILHSCKLARQLGLEAWLSGIEKRHEVDGPGEVYEVFLLGDIREVLGQLLERVKRWQT